MSDRALDLVCVECPKGCRLRVAREEGGEIQVSGHACQRGEGYGKRELLSPARTLTGTVRTTSRAYPRLPVRTAVPIPRDRLVDAARALAALVAAPPLVPGDVLASDFAGLGVDLVATDELRAEAAR